MVASLGIRVAGLLLALSTAAISQERLPFNSDFKLMPNTIASIPPLAQAVLTGDREQVIRAIKAGDDVNAKVIATDGSRAGFTPLILAATLSNSDIVQLLVENKANVTLLDDFHRSAFWYAALRGSLSTAKALGSAADVEEVINEPDSDLKRTPLHLAVRGRSPDLVHFLVERGASASKEERDILDETPGDYCKLRQTPACRAF